MNKQICYHGDCTNDASLRCKQCGMAHYCGVEHQKADWKARHKAECRYAVPPLPIVRKVRDDSPVDVRDAMAALHKSIRFVKKTRKTHMASMLYSGCVKRDDGSFEMRVQPVDAKLVPNVDQIDLYERMAFPSFLAVRNIYFGKSEELVFAFLLLLQALASTGRKLCIGEHVLTNYNVLVCSYKGKAARPLSVRFMSADPALNDMVVKQSDMHFLLRMDTHERNHEVFLDPSGACHEARLLSHCVVEQHEPDWYKVIAEIPAQKLAERNASERTRMWVMDLVAAAAESLGVDAMSLPTELPNEADKLAAAAAAAAASAEVAEPAPVTVVTESK